MRESPSRGAATSREDLSRIYTARFAAQVDQRRRVWRILVDDFFQQFVPLDGCVLDVGCGWGEFINSVSAKTKYAIDLNPDSKRWVSPPTTLFQQSCAETWPLESDCLDVVFTSNFLEHLPTKADVSRTVEEAYRCLRPGGRIICLGPNIRYVPGDYWDFFDHHVPLSERSMTECLEIEGFHPEQVVARFLPYTMANSRPAPRLLIRAYLKLRFAWPLFGKQFLVVATKPKSSARSP